MAFKDDFTKLSEAKPMHRKTEVLAKIKEFITHYETGDRRCHRLKSDNADKYLDKELAA